jgi:hypothetical protein
MHALGELETLLDSFWLIAVPFLDTSRTIDRDDSITFSYGAGFHCVTSHAAMN